MTASDRADFIASLQHLLDVLRANPSIPAPRIGRECFPLSFYAEDADEPQGPLAIAASLGLAGVVRKDLSEEDMWPYVEATGLLGVLHVRIAADDGPPLSVPLPGGRIIRMEPVGEAAL